MYRSKLCLAADDSDSGLEVRRGDVGDESPLKAVADPVFQCFQLSGRLVRGDDDLLALGVQLVEGVEELLLHPLFAGEELDVVDEQNVGVAVLVVELCGVLVVDAGDEVVAEFLAGDVDDLVLRMILADLVGDGVHQVGLAQTGGAVDEQGL